MKPNGTSESQNMACSLLSRNFQNPTAKPATARSNPSNVVMTPSLCIEWYLVGGGKRDRTADLLHAMQALSQLSYTPNEAAHYKDDPGACKHR